MTKGGGDGDVGAGGATGGGDAVGGAIGADGATVVAMTGDAGLSGAKRPWTEPSAIPRSVSSRRRRRNARLRSCNSSSSRPRRSRANWSARRRASSRSIGRCVWKAHRVYLDLGKGARRGVLAPQLLTPSEALEQSRGRALNAPVSLRNAYGARTSFPSVALRTDRMKAKVCLVGEAAVGKTSMVRRFVLDEFDDRYVTTLGAKVSKKEVAIDVPPEDLRIQLDMTVCAIMSENRYLELRKYAYIHAAR